MSSINASTESIYKDKTADDVTSSTEEKSDELEVSSPSIDPENEVTGLKLLILHLGLCLCTFLVGLDFTLVATAIPSITSHFDSVGDVGWYGGAFYLALCASQPLAARLYLLFPKKVVYLSYVALLEIGSLVCALAPSSKALIAGRAVTGLGSSGILAGGLIIIITVIPLHKRAIWQGTITSMFSLACVVGPVIGGALTQYASWRWCFWINLPIGAASASVVLFFLNVKPAETERSPLLEKLRGLDLVGFALFAGAIAMLLLALQWGGITYAWNSSIVIGLFVGFGCTLPLFLFQQYRLQDNALIPPRVLANRNFALIFGSGFFSSGSFQTVIYWLPIWFQAVVGVSPTDSGVRYLAVVISDVLTSFIGPAIMQVFGYWNPFLLFGLACLSIGSGLLTTLHPTSSAGHWIGFEILCGVGYALVVTVSHMGVQASLPPDLVPIGATTLLFMMSASSAVWLAVAQSLFQDRLISLLSGAVSPDTLQTVLMTGATDLRSTFATQNLEAIIQAYGSAITDVFYVPAAAPVIAFLLICGTTWTSFKKDRKREESVHGHEDGT